MNETMEGPGGTRDIDDWIKCLITDWKVARGELQTLWAKTDLAEDWGHKDVVGPDEQRDKLLNALRHSEKMLAGLQPRSILTATEMLGMATEIMAYARHDPEHTFADQSVCLDIVRNVRDALQKIDDKTPLVIEGLAPREADEGGAISLKH